MLNNGTEESKGTPEHKEAYTLLKNNDAINFIGNIEGRDLYGSDCDVVVTDGFSGNIALKTLEGGGKYFSSEIKKIFKSGILSAIAYLLVKNKISAFKDSLDYRIYGGAPFLGVKKTVVKAHGSSDRVAIYHTVAQAVKLVKNDLIGQITKHLDNEVSEDVK
jgi:glycerol-3-phosphate acyltransferase PlsX